jgi:glycosyltransferase involved in cell wall biosynthesis
VPDVSVIVPARDVGNDLDELLVALGRQRFSGTYEVIVVDNGSRDDTAAHAERVGVVDQVIRRARGEGVGAARNAGAAAARGEALAFTDADCRPAPDWLAAGMRALEDADLVQGAVRPDPNVPMGPYDRSLGVTADRGLYQTANLLVDSVWFARVGGFRDWSTEGVEGGSRPFGEDVVFAWHARRAGARARFAPDALVHHAVIPGTSREWLGERLRVRHFAALAAWVPELREAFFYRRWFLSSRSAAFDLAIAGAVYGIARRRAIPAVAAAVPYARLVVRDARRWGWRRAPAIAGVRVVGDALASAALIAGSLRARSPLF